MAKNKRIKSKEQSFFPISDWEEADNFVRDIGDLRLKINQAEHRAKDSIDEIKAELAEEVKPHQEAIKLYHRSLEIFAANHPSGFGRKRSRKLNFGLLGWRKSTSISIKKNTFELIRAAFAKAKAKLYIRTKETVDKDALAKLTDEQLAAIGARRKEKDVFFVEPELPEAVDYVD